MTSSDDLRALEDDDLPSMEEAEATVELANILSLDLVGSSEEPLLKQMALITRLQHFVRETQEYLRARKANTLVTAPAGDGIALAFLGGDLAAPLRCSIQLTKLLNERGRNIRVRMGIHSGAVSRYRDANDLQNLAGPGVRVAALVMSFGDDRHILVSEETANLLREDDKWRPHFQSLGAVKARNDRILAICSFHFSDVGNPNVPAKFAAAVAEETARAPETPISSAREVAEPGLSSGARGVIEMFAELGLRVCDDDAAIKEAFDQKRKRYLALTAHPEPRDRRAGQDGIKNGTLLQQDRPRLLQIVFDDFVVAAKEMIEAAAAEGISRVTMQLRDRLLGIARDQYKADDTLARGFLAKFLEAHGLESDDSAVKAEPANQPRMLVTRLAVSYERGAGGVETLLYAPQMAADDDSVAAAVRKQISAKDLRNQLATFQRVVGNLVELAKKGADRGELGIEQAAAAIARHVRPAQGLAELVGKGVHPQFQLLQDIAGQIPWESLEETYFNCGACGFDVFLEVAPLDGVLHCQRCGQRMQPTLGKMAVELHLSHVAPGRQPPTARGNRFVILEDPNDNLSDDPNGICSKHGEEIEKLLEDLGYKPKRYKGVAATVEQLESALTDPSVVGIYFFGHGVFDEGEGYLELADHRAFPASRLRDLQATTPFVFLNACDGAGAGQSWNLEEQPRSVAVALAAPSSWRTVIAPICAAVGIQAAQTALAFFRAAKVTSLGEALQVARRESLERYRAGAPDLSWFLYRYFGSPRRCLPMVERAVAKVDRKRPSGNESHVFDRIFDASDQLDPDVFGFGIENVLASAAQRRNAQRRARVSVADFAVGLFSHGDLTRYVLSRGEARDLDEDIRALAEPLPGEETGNTRPQIEVHTDSESPEGNIIPEASPRRSSWERREMEPDLIKLLGAADRDGQAHLGNDQRISERDVLNQIVADPRWDDLVERANLGEFKAREFQAAIEAVIVERTVDDNGQILLGRLGPEARSIIETAHTLAQQRGARSIQNRLMLAAFLKDPKGEAARRCRERKLIPGAKQSQPEEIFEFMLATSEGQQSEATSPRTFGLSPELCARIVEPMLQEARAASPWEPVSEACLFKAFCRCALPDFKAWLKEEEVAGLNLDDLAEDGPEPDSGEGPAWIAFLDPSARRVVRTAHKMSQQVGSFPIRNATLLAAFFQDEISFAVQLLPTGLRFQQLRDWLIKGAIVPGRTAQIFPLNDEACERAVTPMVQRALEMRTDESVQLNEIMLFVAFCQVAPSELKVKLAKERFGLNLEDLFLNLFKRMADAQGDTSHAGPPPAPESPTLPPPSDLPSKPDTESSTDANAGKPRPTPDPPRLDVPIDLPRGLAQSQFDDDAWRCIVGAALVAREEGWPEIRSPHLFAGMLHQHVPVPGYGVLGLDQEKEFIALVLALVPRRPPLEAPGPTKVSANAAAALERAVHRARAANRTRANIEDLLMGFFEGEDRGGVIGDLLRDLSQRARGVGTSGARPPTIVVAEMPPAGGHQNAGSVLASVGRDLTERARKGEIPEIVGREAEIEAALQSLLLRENANPLLVGDAGVGKTAIVEGLARRIALGPCPKKLEGCRIIEIQAGSLVANTRFRGDFEQRMQALLAEARGNVILFIDEIHALIGTGASEGGGPDAGDLLKAALARGELRLIGATTHAEYRQTIARDKALSRRFHTQTIGPPSRDATLRILSARQADLEKYHGVAISEDAKAAAVDLSGRYILDRQWPAKARDVLEQACVLVESQGIAIAGGTAPVTADHIATVVSRSTGIPLERLSANDAAALDTLAARLDRRIVGQTEATGLVVDAIRAGRQGLSTGHKPLGIFLFVGPPGVGKTELAKVLAEEVYGGAEGLIRLDMGDFSEAHAVAKLTGSPPGYVGYREGARLVEALRRRPYSVLLLDEIEHAHEDVMAVFLRLFSEGTIADQDGNVADGRNAIVILTSNVVAGEAERNGVGFAARSEPRTSGSNQASLRAAAEKHLPKKLIDRLDAIIRFGALGPADLETIAGQKVAGLVATAQTSHGLKVSVDPEIMPWLAHRAAEADIGAARAIARVVDEHVGKALAGWLGRVKPRAGAHVIVRLGSDGVGVVEG